MTNTRDVLFWSPNRLSFVSCSRTTVKLWSDNERAIYRVIPSQKRKRIVVMWRVFPLPYDTCSRQLLGHGKIRAWLSFNILLIRLHSLPITVMWPALRWFERMPLLWVKERWIREYLSSLIFVYKFTIEQTVLFINDGTSIWNKAFGRSVAFKQKQFKYWIRSVL